MPLEGRAFFVTRLPAYACYMLISIIQASLKISINTSQAHLLTNTHISGGDALKGHTRSHPEHDG